MRSDRTLKKHFNRINKKFFDGELTKKVCVRWLNEDEDDMRLEDKLFGFADRACDGYHEYQIVMSREMNKPASSRMLTLVHEMIHLATDLRDDHGPAFEFVRQKLSDRGIYKKDAIILGLTIV
jgi:hypothetical protein